MNFDAEIVRSRQNRAVVELCKLTDRKAREASRSFRFDGIKLLGEAIRNGVVPERIFFRESDAERLIRQITDAYGATAFDGVARILVLCDDLFDKISEEKSPEGVISVAKYIDKLQKNATIYNSAYFSELADQSVVLLESIRDPSNVGAVIRSAAAMGVDRLIISADCADIYHPRAVRASMGTLFNQHIDRVADLPAVIRGLRESGRRVFAAALDDRAQRLGSFEILCGDCVVIGNEGHGLSPETLEASSGSVLIPMSARAESLNAAVAASILMWEFSKSSIL